ncbi:copper chaperone PCu(A)C [Denitromonas halophila]|uniref:Copper chaperone PCu(A)C n=1 Tax=Denitromonas halophila TaxID=1629404 RepID=A0A557R0I1_9RHOO|nr:copper chaperone PCu(A)C [Denitromonas halophila]TVO58669.1 copper chaperone PCu(A)C [Denitromonas halophila]
MRCSPLHLATALLALGLPALAPAAGMADSVAIEDAHVRQMPPAAPNTAAFLTVINTATTPIRLTGARSAVANTVELHDHIQDGDILRMRRIDGVDIPAGSRAALAPGGKHVMLIGLKQPLKGGTQVQLTLQFADGSEYALSAPVTPIRPAVMPGMKH